jgi:hypothetical protein
MKAMKCIQISDQEVLDQINKRLLNLSYFTDYQQIVSVCNHSLIDYRKRANAQTKNINKIHIFILMELCQHSLKDEIVKRCKNKTKNLYFTQKELLGILIPTLILLKELKQYKIYHENLKSSKILKGYDGAWKLCGIVCGSPFQDELIKHQLWKKAKEKSKEHYTLSSPQQILEDNYLNSNPYFSPEKTEAWGAPKLLPVESKAKSEIYSLGLILLEVGNLIQNIEQVAYSPKALAKEKQQFKDRYPSLAVVIEKMLKGHKQIGERPNYIQLLAFLQNEGLMAQRLANFHEVQKLYKFHGIDQKIVNKLQGSIELKNKEIEKL